ncbi:CocE/NonD family hydrolase [Puia dinghuensis]|uniref:Xaa-Pro dipeptidyl-peptidase-like domain-containing protein n=1 Tax=Puia dinghuensis TaxID=1792502 RepID=A0A8J2UC09_9BACT|nr:CocE/NonD family hydrolase [Puia dinghuensis]GGA96144.1 hypothetical protein GCM10011511_19300 [Puia dinghuensis]
MKKDLFTFIALIFISISLKAQNQDHVAGYKEIHLTDSSRIYRPGTETNDPLHFRPLDIDLWYPANISSTDTALVYGDILRLLENRANYYTGTANSIGLTTQVAKAFCEGFKCSDPAKLLAFRTKTYKSAPIQKGKWPLVVYLASYGSMCYENLTLLESLAQKGYFVVSIASIGRFPGDMTTEKEDLFEQVSDAVFSIKNLYQNSFIDFRKITIIGYSWGGLCGNLLPDKIPGIACIVSLEGSEFHHYGQKDPDAKKEDSNFNSLVQTQEFRNRSLNVPYLRFESSPSSSPDDSFDSVYHFADALKDKKILQVVNGKHQDFCSISPIVKASGNCSQDDKYATVLNLTLSYIDEKIKDQRAFKNLLEKSLNKSVVEIK